MRNLSSERWHGYPNHTTERGKTGMWLGHLVLGKVLFSLYEGWNFSFHHFLPCIQNILQDIWLYFNPKLELEEPRSQIYAKMIMSVLIQVTITWRWKTHTHTHTHTQTPQLRPAQGHFLSMSEWMRKSLSRVQLFAIPWTIAYHALPSMGFSRQEDWSGLPFPDGIRFSSVAA